MFLADKDISEKRLENYADVFADIVNVLLFNGKQLIQPHDLLDSLPKTSYKSDAGKLHEEERDIAKFWLNGQIKIALVGLENQTDVDYDMIFRVLGYDGITYRDQLNLLSDELDSDGKPKKSKQRFPVITLVLYFGYEKHWTKRRKLSDFVHVPHDLLPYFNDYKLNVFEIAWLDDSTVSKFQSDFRYVADFFVQMRKHKNYKPSNWQIKHVAAFLDLMSVLTGDYRFAQSYTDILERSVSDMKIPFLDEVENRGIEKGIEQGREQNLIENIRAVTDSLNVPIEKAMDILKVPSDKQQFYLAHFQLDK